MPEGIAAEATGSESPRPTGVKPIRGRLSLTVGERVAHGEVVYRVEQVLDRDSLVGTNVETGRATILRVGELRPAGAAPPGQDLAEIADPDWRLAQTRLAAIKPLLDRDLVGRAEVERRAAEVGVHATTLYRWVERYRSRGSPMALVPRQGGWPEGTSRLTAAADAIIEEVIQDFYLTPRRPTVGATVTEVRRLCLERGVALPSAPAVRLRVSRVSQKDALRSRGQADKARQKFEPAPGSFPGADYPLAVVQMDNHLCDLEVVDDVYRKPVGRPVLTLAIDVFSRMVVGYHLSLDAASGLSAGLAMAHGILPKGTGLVRLGVDGEWPVYGVPKTLHVDNGMDFRAEGIRRACAAHDISMEFRPIRRPRYGGHVERVFGTLEDAIHALPGTTFASVAAREGYDSEKHAAMTLREFEQWLVKWICTVYHVRKQRSLGMSPLSRWDVGIFGHGHQPGIGLPDLPADPETLIIDFLPSVERTIQPTGVSIEGLRYYSDVLRDWIGVSHPERGAFTFRRDPRDISAIWFFEPRVKEYFKVPLAEQRWPATSDHELRQVKAELKRQGHKDATEEQLLRALGDLRLQVDAAEERSKAARKEGQRRRRNAARPVHAPPKAAKAAPSLPPGSTGEADDLFDGDVSPFGDIA